jgi:formate dehydrogenase subunit gamma
MDITKSVNKEQEEMIVRFGWRSIIEHLVVMILFIILAITGLPQKFFDTHWARWIISALGGIDQVRTAHRVIGIVFTMLVVFHLTGILYLILLKRVKPSMLPNRKDFTDAIVMLRYYLGVSEESPQFDRYDYRQKFEYWGMVFGGFIMIVTGFILYFPVFFTGFLPGEIIPAAKVAHSAEGLLAFLVVVTWHIYNAHLNPDVFPFDFTIFTGKISTERMLKEHLLEYMARKGKSQ